MTNELEEENKFLKQKIKELERKQRKYVQTLSELIDRLSINSLKELLIPEHKKEYAQEISEILQDINLIIEENNVKLNSEFIRTIIVLTIMNREIWLNEANWRKGIKTGNNLELSHSLNSIRNLCKNKIQERIGGRKDYKLDNVEAHPNWIPSGYTE